MTRTPFNQSGFNPKGKQPANKTNVRERLEQAQHARRAELERHRKASSERAAQAKAEDDRKAARPKRDADRYCNALSVIPFWMIGEPHPFHVAQPYLALSRVAVSSMNDECRHAVLCWPNFQPSPAAIGMLLSLAANGSTDAITHAGMPSLTAPIGLRALIYPYARTVHRGMRHLYPDKEYLGKLHTKHQVRAGAHVEDAALADFHKTLARVKTLSGISAHDGQRYDEYMHPCLDEIAPFGPCVGNDGRNELLWRVRAKTDLKAISRSGKADDPGSARFHLFGLRATEDAARSLASIADTLDLVVCDLTTIGRNRLGRDWQQRVRDFLALVDRHAGHPVATIALTDDPWSFDALRFELLSRSPRTRETRRPEPSTVLFAQGNDIVTQSDWQPPTYKDLTKVEAGGFSGDTEAIIQGLRSARHKANELGDREVVDLLGRLQGAVRRCASLPGSQRQFSEYLESQVGGTAAADIISAYRVNALTKQLEQSQGAWSQHAREELERLAREVARIWDNTAQLTPMAPLLLDFIRRFKGVSSRTAVLFRNDMMADFATHVLCTDPEIGEAITSRIDKGMIMFVDGSGLDDLSLLPATSRNHIKTLIAVAPTRAQILSLLAKPWLPDNFIALADSDTLAGSASDVARLARYPELSPIEKRFVLFEKSASSAIHRNGIQAAEYVTHDGDEFDLPTSSIVNLAGKLKSGQSAIRLTLASGQIVIARPGTKIILYDASRVVPTFVETDAKDVEEGDRVCAIGDAFVEMARPILNITVRAAEEIRDYHLTVAKRFAGIQGHSQAERLGFVVAAMQMENVTAQRASYWVDLQEQFNAPLHEVVPHAPRDRATFLSFMKVLGVSEAVALRFWTWAIIAQRASRLRAALNFHEAYRTILVDNYAAQSSNPERAREIRRLKAAAEEFVSVVRTKSIERGEP